MTRNERRLIVRAGKLFAAIRKLGYAADPDNMPLRQQQAQVTYQREVKAWNDTLREIHRAHKPVQRTPIRPSDVITSNPH